VLVAGFTYSGAVRSGHPCRGWFDAVSMALTDYGNSLNHAEQRIESIKVSL
jgi:hypothetical protein